MGLTAIFPHDWSRISYVLYTSLKLQWDARQLNASDENREYKKYS